MKFTELKLETPLQQAIDKLGYQDVTKIQEAAIPHILEGRDVAGLAQTGTGKTAAFVIPLMDRILKGRLSSEGLSEEDKAHLEKRQFSQWKALNFILVLVPTRELAEQVYDNIQKLSEFSGLRGISVYGGTSYEKQKEGFKQGVEFVVATPGRFIDLYKENIVDLKQVRAVVFDEADRMFDMGFKDDMKYILQRIPKERQFLVFSATLNFDVLNTAYQFGAEPVEIDVSRDQPKAENVKDEIYHVGQEEKPMYLLSLLKKNNPSQVIIFSNFKLNVEKIAKFLSSNGFPAMGISSLLTQAQRNRVIELFKAENEKNILVATDVAARGLDIKGVDMVINYELPNDAESYVHRIGRTGRAGAEGKALSLVSDRDVESIQRIEDYLKHKVNVGWLDEADFVKEFQAFPRDDFYSRSEGNSRGGERGGRGGRHDNRNDRSENRGDRGSDRGGRGPRGGSRGPRDPQRDQNRDNREHRAEGPGARGEHRKGGRRDSRDQRDSRDPRDQRDARDPRSENRPHEKGTRTPHHAGSGSQRPAGKGAHASSSTLGSRSHQGGHKKTDQKNFKSGQKHTGQHRSGPRSNAQVGVVQKVTGFFKRLFS